MKIGSGPASGQQGADRGGDHDSNGQDENDGPRSEIEGFALFQISGKPEPQKRNNHENSTMLDGLNELAERRLFVHLSGIRGQESVR